MKKTRKICSWTFGIILLAVLFLRSPIWFWLCGSALAGMGVWRLALPLIKRYMSKSGGSR
jgi:hypothetical protein